MTTRAKAEARKARAIEREKGFKVNPAETIGGGGYRS